MVVEDLGRSRSRTCPESRCSDWFPSALLGKSIGGLEEILDEATSLDGCGA